MIWATGVALLVPIYPEWSGRIASLIESFESIGQLFGPMIGSYMYSIGGYALPFAFTASCEFILAIICIFFVPNKCAYNYGGSRLLNSSSFISVTTEKRDDINEDSRYTFVYFSTRPTVLLVFLPIICHSLTFGFIDVAGIEEFPFFLVKKFKRSSGNEN